MIRSMTGYGAGEFDHNGLHITVEIRSVNGRFCEISLRLPKSLAPLENRIREKIQSGVHRGSLSVSIRCDGEGSDTPVMVVDAEAGQRYYQGLKRLQEELGLPGEITIAMIAGYPGLLKVDSEAMDVEQLWPGVDRALSDALVELTGMKEREGNILARDLSDRIGEMSATIDHIAGRAPERIEYTRQRLNARIAELLGDDRIDTQRLAMEVTLFADRSDITEECVRLRAHCESFLAELNSEEHSGRRMNFLLQEMNREVNTIGAKANDAGISHQVITLKEELEKIREQVQNIE